MSIRRKNVSVMMLVAPTRQEWSSHCLYQKKDLSFLRTCPYGFRRRQSSKDLFTCQYWGHQADSQEKGVADGTNKPIVRGYHTTIQDSVFRPFKLELKTQDWNLYHCWMAGQPTVIRGEQGFVIPLVFLKTISWTPTSDATRRKEGLNLVF